jgi:hypothetical protein
MGVVNAAECGYVEVTYHLSTSSVEIGTSSEAVILEQRRLTEGDNTEVGYNSSP